jgi:hypothetical protein
MASRTKYVLDRLGRGGLGIFLLDLLFSVVDILGQGSGSRSRSRLSLSLSRRSRRSGSGSGSSFGCFATRRGRFLRLGGSGRNGRFGTVGVTITITVGVGDGGSGLLLGCGLARFLGRRLFRVFSVSVDDIVTFGQRLGLLFRLGLATALLAGGRGGQNRVGNLGGGGGFVCRTR